MPLSPADLQRAAMACRLAAAQSRKDAEAQPNPETRAIFERQAEEYARLAERFERARTAKITARAIDS